MQRGIEMNETIRSPDAEASGINRFAFVLHPLSVDYIFRHPALRWARSLPRRLVENLAAHLPPMPWGRVAGGRSPATGQQIEGFLYSLGATPRQILTRDPEFTYRRLDRTARLADRQGARILGLGAFTKVAGDAGVTVARRAPIAVTSGNSLTVAATLETAKITAQRLGFADLGQGRAMVVGATGAIGSVCARLLAAAVKDVVLISIEPERLAALEARILAETRDARVVTGLTAAPWIGECDLVVTATSAFGQRVVDVSQCKPGAVVLDVALPPDISAEEAALRPDVLVVESGEVVIPGPARFERDIGLPPGVAYACLAEAALLAMDGRFECFTLGRAIDLDRVKEIYRLFRKHGFEIAPLRTFGQPLTDELLREKRALAAELAASPERLARVKAEAGAAIAKIPPRAKGVAGVTALPPPPRRQTQRAAL